MQSPKIVAKGRPKGDTYYKDIASNYEKKRKKQAWWHVEQEQMAQLLDQLPDGMSVVDIPFGTGRFVRMYRKKGFKIAGLDARLKFISQGAKIFLKFFIRGRGVGRIAQYGLRARQRRI